MFSSTVTLIFYWIIIILDFRNVDVEAKDDAGCNQMY